MILKSTLQIAFVFVAMTSISYGYDANKLVPSAYRKIAAEYDIPPLLLYSVALTESEDNYKGLAKPWPWTINHKRKGHFFNTKKEAVAYAKKLLAAGDKNFDIGLMQVNWYWNHRRFSSIEDAFDPYKSIRTAAVIISEYKDQYGSFEIAVGKYHAPQNKENAAAYKKRVRNKLKLVLKGKR